MQKIIREQAISISQFKANPNAAIKQAGENPLAVMSHNSIRFYAVPVALYEQMMRDLGAVEARTTMMPGHQRDQEQPQ